jgi:sulfoxide reductase heme-binding subunit YedZ
MAKKRIRQSIEWLRGLLDNSRFWVLASGIVVSINIAGLVQFLVPSGSLQTIRIEQAYGFIAVGLLLSALFASPITKAFPQASFKEFYLHARRAIGVLAFYYAFLHVCVSFFSQLGGFEGVKYYSSKYSLSISLGLVALCILLVMAATSFDWAIRRLTFPRWKALHRLVYVAGVAVLVHVLLIGSHYSGLNIFSLLTIIAVLALLRFEEQRIRAVIGGKRHGKKSPRPGSND